MNSAAPPLRTPPWPGRLTSLAPLDVDRVAVRRGEVLLIDTHGRPLLWVHDLEISVENIATVVIGNVATDGYANSFGEDRDFLKVGSDLLSMIREDGPDPIEQELEGWLAETSRDGSGDDITLGLVFRAGARSRSLLMVNGLVNTFGSSIVISKSMWPKSRRRSRSVMRRDSVCGCPALSSHGISGMPSSTKSSIASGSLTARRVLRCWRIPPSG